MNTIKLSNKVRVSDPSYDDKVYCKLNLDVLPGNYYVNVSHYQDSSWGRRVSELSVYHTKYESGHKFNWVEYGEIGVDSAQAGIFCETTYRNDEYADKNIKDTEGQFNFDVLISEEESGSKFYVKMCHMSVNNDDFYGTYDRGVVSRSGYGDGGYPVFLAYDSENNVVGIKIEYISPNPLSIMHSCNLEDYSNY